MILHLFTKGIHESKIKSKYTLSNYNFNYNLYKNLLKIYLNCTI